MSRLILAVLILHLAVPVSAQEPPPVLPSLDALRLKLQHARELAEPRLLTIPEDDPVVLKPLLLDIQATVDRIEDRLREHDDSPLWLVKVFENRYVQIILAGVATWVTTWQVTKE